MSTTINKAITNFEKVQTQYHSREAIERLQAKFAAIFDSDDLDAARALVEKVHLVCGDRRIKHVSVRPDRRQS